MKKLIILNLLVIYCCKKKNLNIIILGNVNTHLLCPPIQGCWRSTSLPWCCGSSPSAYGARKEDSLLVCKEEAVSQATKTVTDQEPKLTQNYYKFMYLSLSLPSRPLGKLKPLSNFPILLTIIFIFSHILPSNFLLLYPSTLWGEPLKLSPLVCISHSYTFQYFCFLKAGSPKFAWGGNWVYSDHDDMTWFHT